MKLSSTIPNNGKATIPIIVMVGVMVIALFNNSFTERNGDVPNVRRKLLQSPGATIPSNRQPMDAIPIAVVPKDQRMPAKKIRYAAFGTSIAWGAELEARKKDAFIWQLSPRAANFAIRATGAEYPAKCLSSLIGKRIFDVIVLEFTMRLDESAYALAQRLRQRFPDAIIITLMNWTPVMLQSGINQIRDIRQLASDRGFENNYMHDPHFQQFIRESGIDWKLDWGQTNEISERMTNELGVISTSTAFNMKNQDPIQWLIEQSERFSEDSFHLSTSGHKDAARRIRQIVNQVGVPTNPRVNAFDMKDNCHNWFESGTIDKKAVKYSPSGFLHPLPTNKEKYALSFEGGKGWMTINNPANYPQDLYISYLTTSPAPSFYPTTAVSFSPTMKPAIVLDQTPERDWGSRFVHLPKEVYIGQIPPGKTDLHFRSLREETTSLFSLVSFTMTPFKI